jgi:hypothetical protein
MSEEKKREAGGEGNNKGAISRREFTIGSIAAIGAYSITDTDIKAEAGAAAIPFARANEQTLKLEISDAVRELLDKRHILEQDLEKVIDHAERTGEKLYQPGTNYFLSKLKVGDISFYVEYSPFENGHRIHTAYAHRFSLEGE